MLLRTLGTFALESSDFSRPKPLLLAAYLTLEGQQTRSHLAELFWPDAANPLSSLSTALSQLKQVLQDELKADRYTVSCTVPCDADLFLKALHEERLSAALALYEGDFLQRLSLPKLGSELEEWIYLTRECLALRLRAALLTASEQKARQGQFAAAARQAEQVYTFSRTLPLEPESIERLHRLFAAAAHPRLAALERQARRLGLELPPKAGARAQLQAQRVATDFVYNLPTYETLFVGRSEERARLMHLLASGHRLITLVGLTGVGKTRLSVQVARESWQLGILQDGAGFVALDAVSSAEQLLTEMARALGLDPSTLGAEVTVEQLARTVGTRNVLLILDGFEQLSRTTRTLSSLLSACPRLQFIVTSHERLNLSAEWLFPVEAFALPERYDASAEARHYHAGLQLFTLRARRARPSFSPTVRELETVHELCRLVGGLPLAIELAAAWVKVMSPNEILLQLETSLELLSTSLEDVPERHRSLNAALTYSWGLLPTSLQAALRRLAVFEGSFSFEEAARVADVTLLGLAGLVDMALVQMTEGRYDRHPLVLRFSRQKLEQNPAELEALQQRLRTEEDA